VLYLPILIVPDPGQGMAICDLVQKTSRKKVLSLTMGDITALAEKIKKVKLLTLFMAARFHSEGKDIQIHLAINPGMDNALLSARKADTDYFQAKAAYLAPEVFWVLH